MIIWKEDGLQDILSTLNHTNTELQGIPENLDMIKTIYHQSTEINYSVSGRPAWAERKKKYAWPLLIKSGQKRESELNSLQTQTWQKTQDGWVLIVHSTDYGVYHQTPKAGARLPMRESIKLTSAEENEIIKALQEIFK